MPNEGDFVKTILFDGAKEISSVFGPRVMNGVPEIHKGWDFAMPIGTKLYAPADGTYYWGLNDGNGGQYGRIKRNDGTYDYFFHCSKTIAKNGTIKKGQPICYSGNSGHSTGPHLHWERRRTAYSSSYFNDINSILITNDMATVTFNIPATLPKEGKAYVDKVRPDVKKSKGYDVTKISQWGVPRLFTEVMRDAVTYFDRYDAEVAAHKVTKADLKKANATIASQKAEIATLTSTSQQLMKNNEVLRVEVEKAKEAQQVAEEKLKACQENCGGENSWVGDSIKRLLEWATKIINSVLRGG